jgi:hypothetical protein
MKGCRSACMILVAIAGFGLATWEVSAQNLPGASPAVRQSIQSPAARPTVGMRPPSGRSREPALSARSIATPVARDAAERTLSSSVARRRHATERQMISNTR